MVKLTLLKLGLSPKTICEIGLKKSFNVKKIYRRQARGYAVCIIKGKTKSYYPLTPKGSKYLFVCEGKRGRYAV